MYPTKYNNMRSGNEANEYATNNGVAMVSGELKAIVIILSFFWNRIMTSDKLRTGRKDFSGRDVSECVSLRADNLIVYYLIKIRG